MDKKKAQKGCRDYWEPWHFERFDWVGCEGPGEAMTRWALDDGCDLSTRRRAKAWCIKHPALMSDQRGVSGVFHYTTHFTQGGLPKQRLDEIAAAPVLCPAGKVLRSMRYQRDSGDGLDRPKKNAGYFRWQFTCVDAYPPEEKKDYCHIQPLGGAVQA